MPQRQYNQDMAIRINRRTGHGQRLSKEGALVR